MEQAQEIEVVVGLKASSELEELLGANFRVPLVEKHSPVVMPLILYLHDQFNHRGVESTYRLSFGNG